MKYSDLFSLNPIKSVIKIDQADEHAKAKQLVSTFVITPSLGEAIEHVALPQLDFESGAEGKGIFVVGNYGTGKSHVMGFLSLVAEDASMLDDLKDDAWRPKLERFAGRYKVKRCELGGSTMSFYEIVAFYLEELAGSCSFELSFKAQNEVPDVGREFRRFMQTFEQHFPDKGVLLIIDELLEYLKGRRDEDLAIDLGVLRKLGQFCDGSRFAIMLGVQKSLFEMPRLQFVADEVGHIRARFHEFRIDKKGVEQLIERYLFQKNEAQKQEIKKVLLQHKDLYEVIEDDLERFAALFPAHPRFIDEFQNVVVVERREILTLLSQEGQTLLDHDFPGERLELITSDRYWRHIEADAGLNANQDVSQVKRNISTLKTRIQNEFGAQEDKDAAVRLVEALGVNRLTTPSIKDPVGLTPENLKNNLLWWTKIPMRDATLLTQSAKRLLTKARERAAIAGIRKDAQSPSGRSDVPARQPHRTRQPFLCGLLSGY